MSRTFSLTTKAEEENMLFMFMSGNSGRTPPSYSPFFPVKHGIPAAADIPAPDQNEKERKSMDNGWNTTYDDNFLGCQYLVYSITTRCTCVH